MTIQTMYAEKLFGRGRWKRRAWRLYCKLKGHNFTPWHYDWDEFEPDHPRHDEPLLWLRGCGRNCGCVQTARYVPLARAYTLPGRVGMDLSLYLQERR